MRRPHASDWAQTSPDISHSESLQLWYSKGNKMAYDRTSADHNGITGMGSDLRNRIKGDNRER